MGKSNYDYGEIYFLGGCNFKCYFCVGREMFDLQKDNDNQLRVHFSEWKNFEPWLSSLVRNNIKTIYLSSTVTEPLLYKYLEELVDYLQDRGFDVGVRTNISIVSNKNIHVLEKMRGEVSLSIQSLVPDTFTKITGVPMRFDTLGIISSLSRVSTLRCTVVVNQYNYLEIPDILKELEKMKHIDYVQLRKYYRYDNNLPVEEIEAFAYVKNFVGEHFNRVGNFKESLIFETDEGLKVSLWETVFKKDSLKTTNYWTNGLITGNNLLVEGYSESKVGIKRYDLLEEDYYKQKPIIK